MRFARSVASLCLLTGVAFTIPGCKSAPADDAAVPEVQQWMDQWKQAFIAKNVDAINALYSPDFVVAYDVIPPLQYVGKDAYMKDWKEFFAEWQGPLGTEFKDTHISTSGDMAYTICLERLEGTTTKGVKVDSWVRVTSVLKKTDGKWLDIHDHVSYPVDMDAGKAFMDLKP